jgi:hypothetical protein
MDIKKLPKDKTELIAHIEREWTALLHATNLLTPKQMTTPDLGGWSPKDNLAHLATWEQFMLRCYLHGQPQHQALQINEATLDRLDQDGVNQILFERNRFRPTEDILRDLHESHAQVLAALEQMEFADLMCPYPDDPQRKPVIIWVMSNTYEHYQKHQQAIQSIVED